MANVKEYLWLSTRHSFSIQEKNALLDRFGSPELLYYADEGEYALLDLTRAQRMDLMDKDLTVVEGILESCDRLDIHILCRGDSDYPGLLERIPDPPLVLYWKGRGLQVDRELTIAMVGTRSCSEYGKSVAGRLALDLARSGATLVSGIAQGIDTAAIRGCLKAGGSVISVLAGGIDIHYPYENRYLYEDVSATGTLVSEYPPGTPHKAGHFLIRNRLIAGLSDGVVVVEAPVQSGALNTAHHALDQAREVFAVPGPIGAGASIGANKLIQAGEAKLILSAGDIIEEFDGRYLFRQAGEPLGGEVVRQRLGTEETATLARRQVSEPVEHFPGGEGAKRRKDRRKNRALGGENGEKQPPGGQKELDKPRRREYISYSDSLARFGQGQSEILLSTRESARTVDELVAETGRNVKDLLPLLTLLQLEGALEEQAGKRFFAAVAVGDPTPEDGSGAE